MKTLALSSPRLHLIPFGSEEVDLFYRMNTTPFVRQYLWDDEVISLQLAEQILTQNTRHFEEDGFGLWKIIAKESEAFIGYTGLWFFFEEPQPQLIYALEQDYTGHGYATEAARLIIDYAFHQLDFDYLIAATDEPHTTSQAVAIRLGMKRIEPRYDEGKATVFFRLEKT